MAENLITNAELASYAPDLDTSAFDATTTSGIISRASAKVIEYCHVDGFLKTAVTNERERVKISSQGDLVLSFRRRPVADGDVSAIRLRTVDINQSLTLSNNNGNLYFIPEPGTYLIYPSNYLISYGRGLLSLRTANLFYEMDYTGGYATDVANLPPALKEAATLFVRDILSTRYNPAGVKSFSQGSYSQTNSTDGESTFVKAAKVILDNGGYARKVF